MPTIIDNEVTYKGGEDLPAVGSPSYLAAQKGNILDKTGPTVVSTNGARREVNNYSNTLDGYLRNGNPGYVNPEKGVATDPNKTTPVRDTDVNIETYADPYTKMLDQMSSRSDDATKMLIATVNANRANRGEEVEKSYDKYARGLELLGVQSGQLQATPEIIKGQLLQAKNEKLEKLRDLDTEEVKAIADANLARQEKDYALLKDRMDYISQIKKDKLDALKSVHDDEKFYMDKAEYFGDTIYDSIKSLKGDQKEAALVDLSEQTGIPVAYLVAAAASTAQDRIKKASSAGSTASKTQVVNNINALFNDRTPNENGYSVRGKDNYVDPTAYLDAYKQWPYGDAAWTSSFPAKTLINPESYGTLPANIRPASSREA